MKKVLILTTDTVHHVYFCQELRRKFRDIDFFVMEEANQKVKDSADTDFSRQQKVYEEELWFKDFIGIIGVHGTNPTKKPIPKLNSIKVDNVNRHASLDWIFNLEPDLIVVYGTGRIGQELIKQFEGIIVNLHGGDAEKYRGLDSHLWAVYHNDFDSFFVTLHHVNEKFDDGYKIV
ncbi:hypothetical protein LCGC14_2613900, partial [marine sediment metagenome]